MGTGQCSDGQGVHGTGEARGPYSRQRSEVGGFGRMALTTSGCISGELKAPLILLRRGDWVKDEGPRGSNDLLCILILQLRKTHVIECKEVIPRMSRVMILMSGVPKVYQGKVLGKAGSRNLIKSVSTLTLELKYVRLG